MPSGTVLCDLLMLMLTIQARQNAAVVGQEERLKCNSTKLLKAETWERNALTMLFWRLRYSVDPHLDGERYNKQDTRFSESPPGAQFEQSFGTKQKGAFSFNGYSCHNKKKTKQLTFFKSTTAQRGMKSIFPHNSKQLLCSTFKINLYVENKKAVQ